MNKSNKINIEQNTPDSREYIVRNYIYMKIKNKQNLYIWSICFWLGMDFRESSDERVAVVRWVSHVWLFATPRTAACPASLFFTVSQSLPKCMSVELVIPSSHFILCHSLLLPSVFPSLRVFSSELALCIKWPSIGASASASVLPVISFMIDWFYFFYIFI